jgi:hypothetical protein
MIRFNYYRHSWKQVIFWKKKLDKNLIGSIIPCYGCFIIGQILDEDGEWENVIIIPKEGYDLDKQFRKSRERFLSQSYTRGYSKDNNAKVAFDTKDEAIIFFNEHKNIGYSDFCKLYENYQAKFVKARRITLLYKKGIDYVKI